MSKIEIEEIIDCGGIYEVHPSNGEWAVVNSNSGEVRYSFGSKNEAVEIATELNDELEAA